MYVANKKMTMGLSGSNLSSVEFGLYQPALKSLCLRLRSILLTLQICHVSTFDLRICWAASNKGLTNSVGTLEKRWCRRLIC